jgi:hypothetical protein
MTYFLGLQEGQALPPHNSNVSNVILSFNYVQLYSPMMDIRYPKHVGGRRNDNGLLYVLTSVFLSVF